MGQTGARDVRIVRALRTAAVFTAVIKPHLPLILDPTPNDQHATTSGGRNRGRAGRPESNLLPCLGNSLPQRGGIGGTPSLGRPPRGGVIGHQGIRRRT